MDMLISMTDFVLEMNKRKLPKGFDKHISDSFEFSSKVINYANFLKQSLTLGMFVPCDLNGNVLDEPIRIGYTGSEEMLADFQEQKIKKYQEAKELVFFEGFLSKNKGFISKEDEKELYFDIYFDLENIKLYDGKEMFILKTIECLVKYNLVLTESAKKQIGL